MINVGDVKGAVVDSALRQLLATKQAPRVVELGTFVGYGTLGVEFIRAHMMARISF